MKIRSLKRNLESLVKGLVIVVPLTIGALSFANKADATTHCVGYPNIPNCIANYATIQEGIDVSAEGDTVLVGKDTYDQGDGYISWDGKDIVLRNEDRDSTIIQGSAYVSPYSIIRINNVTNNAILENFTIIVNGDTPNPMRKAIYVRNTSGDSLKIGPTIQNNKITGPGINNTGNGKGIFIDGISNKPLHTKILDNVISGFDVGIDGSNYSLGVIAEILRNTIRDNYVAAIQMVNSRATVGIQSGILEGINDGTDGTNYIFNNGSGILISYTTLVCSSVFFNYVYYNSIDIDVKSDCNLVLDGNTFGPPPGGAPPGQPIEERVLNATSNVILKNNGATNNINVSGNQFPQSVMEQMLQGSPPPCEGRNIPEFLDGCDVGYGLGLFTWTVTSVPEHKFDLNLKIKNYPNPFNPVTNIDYELPKDGDVDIGIYDIVGKLIKNLYEGNRKSGKYSLTWNGKDNSGNEMSSGVYFCHIKFNNKEASNKLVLVR